MGFFFKHLLRLGGGGGLIERAGLFNLAKMMALILHKEIERKINKLRNMRLGFMHANKTKKKNNSKKVICRISHSGD